MIAKQYAEIQGNPDVDPIRAADAFHDLIDENTLSREAMLAKLSEKQRIKAARQTFDEASNLADLLIENAGDRPKVWFEPETGDEVTYVEIATTSRGTFGITRFVNDDESYYEVSIASKSLAAAQAELKASSEDGTDHEAPGDEWKIDVIAHVDNIAERVFNNECHAELEWAFELLMTIALDREQPKVAKE